MKRRSFLAWVTALVFGVKQAKARTVGVVPDESWPVKPMVWKCTWTGQYDIPLHNTVHNDVVCRMTWLYTEYVPNELLTSTIKEWQKYGRPQGIEFAFERIVSP